jgi:hypothetical protein
LSTRSHGYAYSNYPIIDRFNYVICRTIINGKQVYLDASRPNLGFGMLDWECYNGHARVINEEAKAVELSSDSFIETKMTTLLLYSNEKGETIGSIEQVPGIYESLSIRDRIKEIGLKEYLKEVENEKPSDIEISNYRVDSVGNFDAQVYVRYDIKLNAEKKNIIYWDPLFGEGFTENPFEAQQRTYPIEMPYTLDETFIARIELPKDYEIDEMPKSTRVNLDEEGKSFFEYLIERSGPYISLRSRVKIHRSYFLPEEYKVLKDFFSIVVNKQNEKIGLKKMK